MRHIILTAAFVLAGSAAMASSILPIESTLTSGAESSIISETCTDCPPLVVNELKKSYVVPRLTPGTQKMEVRDVNGAKKIVRTEAWMGGSPVIFMSNPTPEALAAADAPTDGLDLASKTAAVDGTPARPGLDASGFQLRLK